MAQVTIIYEGNDPATAEATAEGENLWVSLADATRIGGWELKPEGLCRGDVCVPVRNPEALVDRIGLISLTALAEALGKVVAVDLDQRVAVVGDGAERRRGALESLEAPDIDWLNVAAGWTFGSLLSGAVVFLIAGPLRNRPLRLATHILALQPWYACEALVSDGDAPGTGRTVTFLHPTTGVPMGRFAVESGWYGRWLQPMQHCWLLCANGTDGMPSIVAPPSRSAFAHLTKVRRP